ncbi:MAG: GNAT family protein, partial [Patescibacteria group bacterium]
NSSEDYKTFILESIEKASKNVALNYSIIYNNEVVGAISYNYIDTTNRKVVIGYWLGEEFQNKGIMTRSVKHLINNAFDTLDMHRVEIACAKENHRSRKLPTKLGFTEEGVARESAWLIDRFTDNIWYGLLKKEWKS